MKNKKRASPGYRPTASGPVKLYIVRDKDGRQTKAHGHNPFEAATDVAKEWGVKWTTIARECEFIELASKNEEEITP